MAQYNIKVVPSGMEYLSDSNLLDDALLNAIHLEHSCKTGSCGACKAEVLDGIVENEESKEVGDGTILLCQSKAKTDVIIKANYYSELENISIKTLPCKVSALECPIENIAILKLRLPPKSEFSYLPGQYIDLSYKGVKRSYSIANSKSDNDEIELHIRRVESGEMSKFIFDKLQCNQLMRLEGPKGSFFVREGTKPIIFVATGTGIAPVKAMVEDLISRSDKRSVFIYWGMRNEGDLYNTGLNNLAATHSNIEFKCILSQGMLEAKYVQDACLSDFVTLNDFDVYACGSLSMIESAQKLFVQNGLPEDAFHSDAFIPSK
ncbi:FAD-binding oxidoreductase [Enterovibrio baiacu]|uniref:FAD-binding oxidoreductase n=1 Tax=Enterovibrio baiacu TaxID=2491023 RepID=UPI0010129F8C|nr:FAD-binding oxidoreductase [Enterovibrio baiacu]MBE1274793.1 CDP-6-deoxy-delta-3,4-glucoseen reductase [Enterovibrio baiacu]